MNRLYMRERATRYGSILFIFAALSMGAAASAQTFSQSGCAPFDNRGCRQIVSPPPIYSFTATPTRYGQPATLSWHTGFINSPGSAPTVRTIAGTSDGGAAAGSWQHGYCYLSGGEFSVVKRVFFPFGRTIAQLAGVGLGTRVSNPDGSIQTGPIYAATTYTLFCTEVYPGAVVSNSATVTVTPTYDTGTASATLTATPSTLLAGSASTLNWAFTKAASCSLSGPAGSIATLPAAPSPFRFSGNDQSWNVPDGVAKIYAKLWGAGGAGGVGAAGLGGGFTIGTLAVSPAQSLGIMAGGGGAYQGGAAYGGGGAGGSYAGAGGGRSALRVGSEDVMMAGGGGGGASFSAPGGAGGGIHPQLPTPPIPNNGPLGTSIGGIPPGQTSPQGSGAGYCGGSGVSDCITVTGTGQASAGGGDVDYLSGIGMGGGQGSPSPFGNGFIAAWFWKLLGGSPDNGGNGYVKIYALDAAGSAPTGALSESGTYTLSCTTPDGVKTASVPITVIPLPVLSLTSSSDSIPYGGSATVTWSARNVDSCSMAGPGISSSEATGSQSTGALTSNATYELTCQSPAGVQSLSTSIVVGPPPALSISASPASIPYGGSSTLAWSAENVDSCSVTGPGVSSSERSGTANTGALTSGATYTLACRATSGTQTKQATVTVSPPPVISSFSANAAAVNQGQSTTLSWSAANVSSCSLRGGTWGGGTSVSTSGSGVSTGALTATTNFTLTCTNAAGVSSSAALSVTVNMPPLLSIKANPTTVDYNGFSDIDWSATNVTSCVVNNDWGEVGSGLTGHQHRGPFQDPPGETFTLICNTATFGTVASSTTVHVNPIPQPVLSITATPHSIPYGGSSTVAWSAENVDSCTVAGPGVSSPQKSGTANTGALTSGATYTLTCQSPLGTQTKQASVSVSPAPAVSLSAASTAVNQGQSTTLSWSAANVSSCSLRGGTWGGGTSVSTSGSGVSTGALTATTNFTLVCTNDAGVSGSASVSITVNPPPSISFTASPAAVDYGGSSSLSWSAANVSSCSLRGGTWGGGTSVSTSGSGVSTGALTATTTFTLTCQTATYGPQTKTASVAVGAPPRLSITAAPHSIPYGGYSTISWSAENVNSCVVKNNWGQIGSGLSGSQNRGPFQDPPGETFTLVCQSTSGQKTATTTVLVGNHPPAISISADPATVDYNGFSTISWSAAYVDSCTVSNDWGQIASGLSGSQNRGPFQNPPGETFTLTCQSAEFGTVASSTVVHVNAQPQPVLSITANPSSISFGGYSTISWSAENVSSCVVNNDWGQIATGLSGSQYRGPFEDPPGETFTLVCQSSYGEKTASTTVLVGAAPHQTVSLSASPLSVYLGESSTLSWTTMHASTCSLSGGQWGSGTSVASSSAGISTGGLLEDTAFTLTCQSLYGYGAVSDSVTVTTQSLPGISFSANPTSILSGNTSMLTWACPSPPYTSSEGDTNFTTGGAVAGSATVSPSESTTYHVSCIVSGNTKERASARVTVLQPDLTIMATPPKVKKGRTTTITWSAENVTPDSCQVTNSVDGTTWSGDSGTQMIAISGQTTFTLACSAPSGPVSQSVVVNIIPVIQNI